MTTEPVAGVQPVPFTWLIVAGKAAGAAEPAVAAAVAGPPAADGDVAPVEVPLVPVPVDDPAPLEDALAPPGTVDCVVLPELPLDAAPPEPVAAAAA
ncbi:MAG TPA: hypothetical protein VG298_16070 [Acidimicrobiales bacterium]|nr:hypothetical protein [Acidimicrobiales bacterium]